MGFLFWFISVPHHFPTVKLLNTFLLSICQICFLRQSQYYNEQPLFYFVGKYRKKILKPIEITFANQLLPKLSVDWVTKKLKKFWPKDLTTTPIPVKSKRFPFQQVGGTFTYIPCSLRFWRFFHFDNGLNLMQTLVSLIVN